MQGDEAIFYIMVKNYLLKGPVTFSIISEYLEKIREKKDSGGHSVFIGQVRADEINGKRVKAIEYSAYEGMVNAEVNKIKQEVLAEFDDTRSIDIIHSEGIVRAGEISLFVLVSAGHRQHAINACAKAVDLIKARLPVWKKELFEDDTHRWRENEEPDSMQVP